MKNSTKRERESSKLWNKLELSPQVAVNRIDDLNELTSNWNLQFSIISFKIVFGFPE